VTDSPTIELNSGTEIPRLGFGVFQVSPQETQGIVEQALEVGYRHLDTAAAYRNEAGVGKAIEASGLDRDDVFVTTKLWNAQQGHDSALEAFEKSLSRLGLEQVDLYLIHWPVPGEDRFVQTWKSFEELQADGRARAIGVSNFRIEDLERLGAETDTVPAVNQIELHPELQQPELRAYHAEHGIATEARSPLAQGEVLGNEKIGEIAETHEKTPAQVILRWHLQLGNIVFPKSATPERIRENFEIFDFELAADQMQELGALDSGERIGPDPATFVSP